MRENSEAIMEKAYARYLAKIGKKSERMSYEQFAKMHYGKYPERLDTSKTKSDTKYLRNNMDEDMINRFRGRK